MPKRERQWVCDVGNHPVNPRKKGEARQILGHLWCRKHAPIVIVNGKPVLNEFPARGKLIPSTILED